MKITRIVIPDFQQFRDFDLSLTDPNTGEPLDRVCFIGRNGTGKTTLLRIVYNLLRKIVIPRGSGGGGGGLGGGASTAGTQQFDRPLSAAVKVSLDGYSVWLCCASSGKFQLCREEIEQDDWHSSLGSKGEPKGQLAKYRLSDSDRVELRWDADEGDLVIFAPPDSAGLIPNGRSMPSSSLNDALALFKNFPIFHEVSVEQVSQFWKVLIYQIKKREEDWQNFLQKPANRRKSVEQVEEEFAKDHPEILIELAGLWNKILETAGLEFDYESAKKPVQLNENLEAFVRVISSGEPLNYNALSTGIRNFIFRLGHIYSLYFGREIRRGFLLLDEPENSLHPDFLYDLMDVYRNIIHNTQFFTATHNPIIAAQFRPEERVVLNFDDSAHVIEHRGVTPIGDDPNDLLNKDFEVRSLYGKEGIQNWERFLQLRREIPTVTDPQQKQTLIQEYMRIGNAYNFAPDALSQ